MIQPGEKKFCIIKSIHARCINRRFEQLHTSIMIAEIIFGDLAAPRPDPDPGAGPRNGSRVMEMGFPPYYLFRTRQ